MKKLFTLTFTILFSVSMYAQIINASLDNWGGSPEEPFNWETPNKILSQALITVFPVYKSTDAVDGQYSAVLETKFYNIFGTNPVNVPGVISTGTLGLNNFEPVFSKGTPFAFRPDSITAMYKYFPETNDTTGVRDTFQAFMLLTKWNAATNRADTIGVGLFQSADSVTTYSKMVLNVNYLSTDMPDTLMLVFSSSSLMDPQVGSKAFVDNIQDGFPVGISTLPANDLKVNVYPNPAINNVTINISGYKSGTYQFTLYDILGKRVDMIRIDRAQSILDISKHRKGMYFYEIKDDAGRTVKTGKMNIVR